MIKHEGGKWVVYSDLRKRLLATRDTKEEAEILEARIASNPEGINQYTHGGGSGPKMVSGLPSNKSGGKGNSIPRGGHKGETTTTKKGETTHYRGEGGHYSVQHSYSHMSTEKPTHTVFEHTHYPNLGSSERPLSIHGTAADAHAAAHKFASTSARGAEDTEQRSLHLLGALGTVRTEMIGTKEHLVVPVVALMEGVIHAVNAETPEFVPFDTLQKCAESWNGKPITIGHPKLNGKQCSAGETGIWDSHGIGTIRNSRVDVPSKKMLMEALIETSRAKKLHPNMYADLAEGKSLEVSVGAMVVSDHKTGKHTNGKPYIGSWTFAEGDHLAFLPGGRGACSMEMGCGTHRAAAMRVCADHLEDVPEAELKALWENKDGEDSHGRDGYSAAGHPSSDIHQFGVTMRHDSGMRTHLATTPTRKDAEKFVKEAKASHPLEIIDRKTGEGSKSASDLSKEANALSKSAKTSDQHERAANFHREAAAAHGKSSMGAVAHEHFAKQHDKRAESAAARAKMKTAEAGDAAEEQAELVAYQTMRTIMDACGDQWKEASDLLDALIADETEDPTETPAEEAAEETVETARLEAIKSLCYSMSGALSAIANATYGSALSDEPTSRYMAGARHSKNDMAAIQAVHDHSMTLGATCDRANYKLMASNIDKDASKLDASNLNDPNRFYIESVRKAGAR